jgi:ActR/RegA family two-component response regulator
VTYHVDDSRRSTRAYDQEERHKSALEMRRQRGRQKILLVDDDTGTVDTFALALRLEQFDVVTANSGAAAVAAATRAPFNLAVIDYRLPDTSGLKVAQALRRLGCPRFIVISGFLTVRLTVEAMKMGALDVLQKPLTVEEFLASVRAHIELDADTAESIAVPNLLDDHHIAIPSIQTRAGSAAERWAHLVIKACNSDHDPKTLQEWASLAGMNRSSLCESCRLVGVRPHDARDFARTLRALTLASVRGCQPDVLLDVSDRRTLKILLDRAGVGFAFGRRPTVWEHFIRHQTFVATDNEGLRLLADLFRAANYDETTHKNVVS